MWFLVRKPGCKLGLTSLKLARVWVKTVLGVLHSKLSGEDWQNLNAYLVFVWVSRCFELWKLGLGCIRSATGTERRVFFDSFFHWEMISGISGRQDHVMPLLAEFTFLLLKKINKPVWIYKSDLTSCERRMITNKDGTNSWCNERLLV